MRRPAAITIALLAAIVLAPRLAAAQETNLMPTPEANPQAAPGWSFTPGLAYSAAWDDNVLLRGRGDSAPSDFLNVVNPQGTLDYNGRRGQLAASYDGAFLLYRDLSSLNSYDQRGWMYGSRTLSRHVSLFVRNTAASVPTTELAQLVAIPFVRTGSRLDMLRGGVEVTLTKRTSFAGGYDFQWVDFDHSQPGAESLFGGHSHGASFNMKHVMSARLTLTADYAVQHALVGAINETFDIQHVSGGVEYKVSNMTRVAAALGIARLASTEISRERTGPAWRLEFSRRVRRADVDLTFSRSIVPSYGFGGTMENGEATARLRFALARRLYTAGGVSRRQNDPLAEVDLPLRSLWIEANVGYALTPRVHLEGFYSGARQAIDRPGGLAVRNRIGFQIITATPMRIR